MPVFWSRGSLDQDYDCDKVCMQKERVQQSIHQVVDSKTGPKMKVPSGNGTLRHGRETEPRGETLFCLEYLAKEVLLKKKLNSSVCKLWPRQSREIACHLPRPFFQNSNYRLLLFARFDSVDNPYLPFASIMVQQTKQQGIC